MKLVLLLSGSITRETAQKKWKLCQMQDGLGNEFSYGKSQIVLN